MQHTITLQGSAARGSTISWGALSALNSSVSDVARRVLRLRATGKSHLQGPSPDWLNRATSVDLNLSSDKSNELFETANNPTRLLIDAPPLIVAAPDIFSQLQFWEDAVGTQDTAISLLEGAVRSAITGDSQSDFIDRSILNSIVTFSDVFKMGFTSISLNGGPTPPVEITPRSLEVVENLIVTAPDPQKVIISGTLDTIASSRRLFVLILSNGRKIRGFYPHDMSAHSIAANYGRKVLIDGEATFRPSGEISSIVATNVEPFREGDNVWQNSPTARPRSLEDLQPIAYKKSSDNPFARIFGSWPGEETDEELEESLAALG